MKKSLILVAIMIAAATLFAETVTCESKMGKCTYEITSNGNYSEDCTCRDGYGGGEGGNYGMPTTLPTEEECLANLDKHCKNAGFTCKNDAGECHIDQNGEYICWCLGVWSANGATEGAYTGTVEFNEETSEEDNCNRLVEICGTELATLRDVCDMDIFNECISYIKPVEACYGQQWPDEDIKAILDLPAYGNHIGVVISNCCQVEDARKAKQTKWECLDNCTDEDCCKTCGFSSEDVDISSSEESGAEDVAAADTEVPTDGAAVPDESKEESKSDGCSMLFI